jgi:hypothetical protein
MTEPVDGGLRPLAHQLYSVTELCKEGLLTSREKGILKGAVACARFRVQPVQCQGVVTPQALS